jgi:putative addiction module component (TIGR02574 family)
MLAETCHPTYSSAMSKAEILAELPKLSELERDEIAAKLRELKGDDWLDEGELTEDDKRLIEARIAEHERNPDAAIPLEEFEARLKKRLGE